MNTDTELRNHIYFEFINKNHLYESRGAVDAVDEIVNVFVRMIEPQVIELYRTKQPYITREYDETNEVFANSGVNAFFTSFNMKLTINIWPKRRYKGGVYNGNITQDIDGNYILVPEIDFDISAENAIDAINVFRFCLGHELTHSYGSLQYRIKNGKSDIDSIFHKNKYKNINMLKNVVNGSNSPLEAVADILYVLNRTERNAYIAQLKQELMNMKGEITDSKSAFEAVKKTESYERFKHLETDIDAICNANIDDNTKYAIMTATNMAMGRNFTNFEQVRKYYAKRWEKWKKAYLSRASKIAHDVYMETHYMYDGFDMSRSVNLKIQ